MFKIPEKIETKIEDLNNKLNAICGYKSNDILKNIDLLQKTGEVVVGYRASCGTTDSTQKTYRLWVSTVKILMKNGIEIYSEKRKVDNSYATLSGGFWDEYRYFIKKNDKFCSECGQTYNLDYPKSTCHTCGGKVKEAI